MKKDEIENNEDGVYADLIGPFCELAKLNVNKLNSFNLTVFQLAVLECIYNHDGESISFNRKAASVRSSSAMTALVDMLEKHGLISRRVSYTDRRKILLYITEKGFTLMEEVYSVTAIDNLF